MTVRKVRGNFNNRGLALSSIGLIIIFLTFFDAFIKMRLSGEPNLKSFLEKLTFEGQLEGYAILFSLGFLLFFAGLMIAYTLWLMCYER